MAQRLDEKDKLVHKPTTTTTTTTPTPTPTSSNDSNNIFNKSCPIPHRYKLTLMLSFAITVIVALRNSFALVMTHVTARAVADSNNQSASSPTTTTTTTTTTVTTAAAAGMSNVIFSHCPVTNTSNDASINIRGDVMLMSHTALLIGLAVTVLPAGIASTVVSSKLMAGLGMLLAGMISLFFPLVIVNSTPLIFVFRVLQGAFDSCVQNSAYTLLSAWSTEIDKATLLSILTSGFYIAPALASFVTAVTVCFIRWDAVFYILGGSTFLWTLVWGRYFYDTPDLHPTLSSDERRYLRKHGCRVRQSSLQLLKSAPWRSMLTSRGVWALIVAASLRSASYSILTLEQFQYFQDAFDVKTEDVGILLLLPYLLLTVFSVLGGLLSDKLIAMGVSTTATRKTVYLSGYICEGLCMVSLYFIEHWEGAYIALSVAAAAEGFGNVGYCTLMSDLSPQYTGLIFGLITAVGVGVAGVSTTSFISFTAGRNRNLNSWQTIYLVASIAHFAGCGLFAILADATRQPWAEGTQLPTEDERTIDTDSEGCGSCSKMEDNPTIRLLADKDRNT